MFKRYIKRHGKNLGPYYYENVRGPNGKIKSVYVGTNPSQHPKHKLRKPLIFLIVILLLILILGSSLFLLQNKAYIINKVKVQEPDFDIDQILLKVLIRSSEFVEKQIRIVNIGSDAITINSEITGLADVVSINPSSFAIKPGQTKIVVLNFSSFVPGQRIEQQPGVYVGKLVVKSEKAAREIPIVTEIETKNVLFDMNLNPVAIERKVKQGSEATIEVRLFNLQSIESQNVDVEYFAKDMNGNTILTESETVVVKTQASFFKTLSIPKNLKPGPYVFAALAKFGNSVGTASYLFEVVAPEEGLSFVQFCKNSMLCLALSLTTILLLFVLTAYFYFFIGAYLYEKLTGVILAPGKKEEGLEETTEEKEKEKAGEEKLEELKPLPKEAKEARVKPSKKSNKFYDLLDNLNEAIKSKDISAADKLHAHAEELYASLEIQEQEEAHNKLTELEGKKNKLANDIERQEKSRKKEWLTKQKELEKQRVLEERRRLDEERQRRKELERQKAAEEKRKLEEEKEEKPIVQVAEEKKPEKKNWFASLFKREKPQIAEISEKPEEEKPLERKKPKSEVEELEEAIRSLGLFKRIETGKLKPTERLLKEPSLIEKLIERGRQVIAPKEELEKQKPEAKESIFKRLFRKPKDFSVKEEKPAEEGKEAIEEPELIGKSRNFEKCCNVLNKVKEAIANNNISKAKKMYVEARGLYISLEDNKKKEVYDELMDLYNKLK